LTQTLIVKKRFLRQAFLWPKPDIAEFRIETARHAERNRVAFVLSIYAGMRVGEIAALAIGESIDRGQSIYPILLSD
jgi:integrase